MEATALLCSVGYVKYVGSSHSREIRGKKRKVINKKTNQHLGAEQMDSSEGPRPPGVLDCRQNTSTCLEGKIEGLYRAAHWG